MAEVRVETEIAAPIDKVFDFVGDVETHPLYADFVKSVRITSKQRRGTGATFKQVHRGSEQEIDTEMLEAIPYGKIAWVTHESGGDVLVNYWFIKTASGTRVIHTVVSGKFDDEKRRQAAYDNNVRELASLKKRLEEK